MLNGQELSRTDQLKRTYAVVLVVVLVIGGLWLVASPGFIAFALVVLAFLIPGRLQAIFYRRLYRGLSAMRSHKYADAIPKFEGFIDQLTKYPVLNRLLWCNWNIYTVNAEALALNNIGACHIGLRELAQANKALDKALKIDPLYPKPHFNKAVIELINGKEERANVCLGKAEELGFTGGGLDKARRMAESVQVNLLEDSAYPVKISEQERDLIAHQLDSIQPLPAEVFSDITKSHRRSEYVLVVLNDDKTPMEYVMVLLVKCFNFDVVTASALVLQVHESGSAATVGGDLHTLKLVLAHLDETSEQNNVSLAFKIEKKQ